MRPLIIDTNIWVEWLRGRAKDTRELSRDRILVMPGVVALELLSGARDRKSHRVIHDLVSTFERHQRLILFTKEDYFAAGAALADLGWPASSKSNDALIVACARRIGAEVLSKDISDLGPLAKCLSVTLVT
jgi:predicted nucleic acid-binding protein